MTRRLGGAPPALVYRIVNAIRRVLVRVLRRLVPPRVALFEQFTGVWLTQMIHAAAELRLADALVDGPKTAAELAAGCGAQPDTVARRMRALVSVGIFVRDRDGRFALERVAQTLRIGDELWDGGCCGVVEIEEVLLHVVDQQGRAPRVSVPLHAIGGEVGHGRHGIAGDTGNGHRNALV